VKEAVKHCIKEGTLGGFLREHGSEVENMLLTEWNWDDALKVCREEGWEKGIEQGLEKGKERWLEQGIEEGRQETWEGFAELVNQSKTIEDLKKMFETSTR
jgi:flagellar biosynthesis/type III secretory pathway protein FliH